MSTILTDPGYRFNLDPKTREVLAVFSRRRRGLLILRAVTAGAAVLLCAMLLVAALDYAFFLDDRLRWFLSLVGYGLAGLTSWFEGLGRLRDNDPKQLAKRLESADPRLREDLLSAVELADPRLANGSQSFRHRLQRRVGQRVAGIDIVRLLPLGLLRRWLVILLSVAVVCLVLLSMPRLQFVQRMARVMLPGIAIERVSSTKLVIVQPEPASRIVAAGDAIAVIVEVSGAPVDEVRLRWRNDEGLVGETEMMPRQTAAVEEPSRQSVQYAANLSIGSVPVDYRVSAGDALTLWHTLSPRPRPRAVRFDKRYVFPHYARLDDRRESAEHGDLRALIGTRAEVTVHFDQPVEQVTLRYANHGIKTPLQSIDETQQRFRAAIPIRIPGQYQIDATSRSSGLDNPYSPKYAISPVVDAAPVASWAQTVPDKLLVSSLDVVPFAATTSDDLPLDRVIQEYMVNSQPMIQRELATGPASRELELSWDWDLIERDSDPAQHSKLAPADVIRTRVVAIDRRGNRGESRWIELLVTDEGFDADRHQPLGEFSRVTHRLIDWIEQAEFVADQLAATAADPARSELPEDLQMSVKQLRGEREELSGDLQRLIANSTALPTAATLELVAGAIHDLAADLDMQAERLAAVYRNSHPVWVDNQRKLVKEIESVIKRAGTKAARIEQLMRALLGQQLTVGVVSDGFALHDSVKRLLNEDQVPSTRYPRYVDVLIGRMQAIDDLVASMEADLPESTVRHYQGWQRWTQSWTTRLKDATIEPKGQDEIRRLFTQFKDELAGQVHHAMVDGRLLATLTNLQREIQNQLGPVGDDLRRLIQLGQAEERAIARANETNESDEAAVRSRDRSLAATDWDQALARLRSRLAVEEQVHRSRPQVDLQYAADLKLLDRAIENVTARRFEPYGDEPAADVHRKLADAIQIIETRHHGDQMLAEVIELLQAERRLESRAENKVMHPWRLERFPIGIEWVVRQLRSLRISGDRIERIDRSRYSAEFNQARNRITSRQWSADEILTADTPLTTITENVTAALSEFDPDVRDARAVIESYVLSLPELARDAAAKTERAKDDLQSRQDSTQPTVEQLALEQQPAETATEATIERLVNLANTADITDEAERALARDADAAALKLQAELRDAQSRMQAAAETSDDSARAEALDEAQQQLAELTQTLRQTADHFERAENGGDLAESRAALRESVDASQLDQQLQERYEQAEQAAATANRDPQELLEQLEQELQENQPMRDELSDIAERAGEAARRTLEQAAGEERSLNQSLERADPVFQEKKQRLATQIDNLAKRAAAIDQSMLDAAEKSIGWANQPAARPVLEQARQQLRQAAETAAKLGGENALLAEIKRAIAEMSDSIEQASEAIDQLEQASDEASEQDIHQDADARKRTADQVERFERDARNRRLQAANSHKRSWDSVRTSAQRRASQAQREAHAAKSNANKLDQRLKREPDNRESLQRQLDEQRRRAEQAGLAEQAAKQTEQFARDQAKATEQRINQIKNTKAGQLDRSNPAAQLAARMSQQAGEQLDDIGSLLRQLEDEADFADSLTSSGDRVAPLAEQQQRIRNDIGDAAAQLHRAARHEQRLGQNANSERLRQAAEMISATAESAAGRAIDSLQAAEQTNDQAPQASRDVADATDKIRAAAEQLAAALSAQQQSADPSSTAAAAADPQARADGQQLARTLDELDRALADSANAPAAGPDAAQASNGEPDAGSPSAQSAAESGADNPAESPPATAGAASPTVQGAVAAQQQQAARSRRQQLDPSAPGQQQPGEGNAAVDPGQQLQLQPGTGDMPDGGILDTRDTERIGSDWGELRQRRTDDASESSGRRFAPKYRREIEAYFKAVARRAAERQP